MYDIYWCYPENVTLFAMRNPFAVQMATRKWFVPPVSESGDPITIPERLWSAEKAEHSKERLQAGTGEWRETAAGPCSQRPPGLTTKGNSQRFAGQAREHQSPLCKSSAEDSPWKRFKSRNSGAMALKPAKEGYTLAFEKQEPNRAAKRMLAKSGTRKMQAKLEKWPLL